MPRIAAVQQINIADGFLDDCDALMQRCSQFEPLTFDKFTDLWLEMNMGSFYHERTVGAEVAELSEEVVHIAKRYLVANTSRFEESVFGLFLVYCLLTLQPFKGFAALRLVPDDMPAIKRIELVARRDQRYDVLYILGQVLIRGPVQYHASSREYGFEQALRKYHEGTTYIDNYGARPKGVFYRQNEELDIIKELQTLTSEYEDAKAQIRDDRGRLDPNLRYADRDLPSQLDVSLKRIINGLIEEDVKSASDNTHTGNIENRSDRIREIKSRAMSTAVDAMKHLTAVTDKKITSPSSTNNSKDKPDIVSRPGKVKSNSPLKPVTTGSPRKRKIGKKTKAKKKKKRIETSSESDLSDFVEDLVIDDINDNDNEKDINKESFQTVEVEVERMSEDNEPNIEELVEKEYNIEIDTMPIVIRGSVDGGESKKIEIEFIDHYKVAEKTKKPEKTDEERVRAAKEKMKDLSDVSFTPVDASSEPQRARDRQVESPRIENLNELMSKVVQSKYDEKRTKNNAEKYTLKKPERRELKQTHLKSKMRKLGLEPLANFEKSKKNKKN